MGTMPKATRIVIEKRTAKRDGDPYRGRGPKEQWDFVAENRDDETIARGGPFASPSIAAREIVRQIGVQPPRTNIVVRGSTKDQFYEAYDIMTGYYAAPPGTPRQNPYPPIRSSVEHVADETWRYRGWLIELKPIRGGWTAIAHAESTALERRLRKAGYSESFNTTPRRWKHKQTAMAAAMSQITYFERMMEDPNDDLLLADLIVSDGIYVTRQAGKPVTRANVTRAVEQWRDDRFHAKKVAAFNRLPLDERLALVDFSIELDEDLLPRSNPRKSKTSKASRAARATHAPDAPKLSDKAARYWKRHAEHLNAGHYYTYGRSAKATMRTIAELKNAGLVDVHHHGGEFLVTGKGQRVKTLYGWLEPRDAL